jgi:hypothetical protein
VPGRESDVSGYAMKYLYGMSDTSLLGNVDGNRYIAMITRGENKRYFRMTRLVGRRGISLGLGMKSSTGIHGVLTHSLYLLGTELII